MGRTLASDMKARLSMPPFAASNMDGFALTACNGGDILEIIGEASAGTPFTGNVSQGQTVRISTGAMVPDGADRIIIQEQAIRDEDKLTVKAPPKIGQHIRDIGSDFQKGTPLFKANHHLQASNVTLLAAAGHATVSVQSKFRCAIFSTGNELRPVGEALDAGEIYAANAIGLIPLLEQWGADITDFGILPDDPKIIAAQLNKLSDFDIIIPIGGASVGDHDHLRPVFREAGFEMIFETVALRPGKPSWMAKKEKQIAFGLPGNPASSFVCAHLFLRPLLRHSPRNLSAKLDGHVEENSPRETYLRSHAKIKNGQIEVTPFPLQDSYRLTPQSSANALIRVPPMGGPYVSGDVMDIILIGPLTT
jgi:molybdopterin molybdotransferase